jgi:phage gp45-like
MTLATDKPQAMPVTEDPTSQEGKPLHHAIEGDSAATHQNSAPILVGKDPSGNLQYLSLNSNNEVIVDSDSAEVACLSDTGKVTGNNSTEQLVVSITLQASTEYKEIGYIVSNFRQSEYRIIAVDDVGVTDVETELATILVGPGDYTDSATLDCLTFTSGSTGVQELQIVGLNKDAASDLRATISAKEIV